MKESLWFKIKFWFECGVMTAVMLYLIGGGVGFPGLLRWLE